MHVMVHKHPHIIHLNEDNVLLGDFFVFIYLFMYLFSIILNCKQSTRARPNWRTDHYTEGSSVISASSVNAPMRNLRFISQCIESQSRDYALAHWQTKRRWWRKLPLYDPSVNMATPLAFHSLKKQNNKACFQQLLLRYTIVIKW